MRRSEDFRRTVRQVVSGSDAPPCVGCTLAHATDRRRDRRVGFVVGKTVGNAVTRNRVRRRLRHLAAAELPGVRRTARAWSCGRCPGAATAPDEVPIDFATPGRRRCPAGSSHRRRRSPR